MQRHRWRSTAFVVLFAAVLSTRCAPPHDATAPPVSSTPTANAAAPASVARVRALLARARVVDQRPHVPGYDRDCGPGDACVFGTEWSDDTDAPQSHNGCDTRNDVLAVSLTDVEFDPDSFDCDVVAGTLVDPYTGTVMDYATQGSLIHVDHLFPLAAAWDLGAAAWPAARRAAFANDTDTDTELIAVQGTANLQKGDSTPASWIPPLHSYRCAYVTAYLNVADAYDLAITVADVDVIEAVVRKRC